MSKLNANEAYKATQAAIIIAKNEASSRAQCEYLERITAQILAACKKEQFSVTINTDFIHNIDKNMYTQTAITDLLVERGYRARWCSDVTLTIDWKDPFLLERG